MHATVHQNVCEFNYLKLGIEDDFEKMKEIVRRYDEVLSGKASKVDILAFKKEVGEEVKDPLERLRTDYYATAISLSETIGRLEVFERDLDVEIVRKVEKAINDKKIEES